MTLGVPERRIPGSSWRRTFADALIRLLPEINPDTADELSDSAYLSLGALEPYEAAARYCQDCKGRTADGRALADGVSPQHGPS